jgi:hypothetical protein
MLRGTGLPGSGLTGTGLPGTGLPATVPGGGLSRDTAFRGAASRGAMPRRALRGAALGGVLVASAALVTVALGGTAQATMPSPAKAAVAVPAAPALTCEPGLNQYDRTQFCFRVGVTVSVLRGTAQVGTVSFDLMHYFQLSARKRDFTERIAITDVHVTGGGNGVHMRLAVSCASPCAAADHFPQGVLITSGTSGVIDYRDGVQQGKEDVATSSYALYFTKSGDEPGGYSYRTPISYRCDDELPGAPAGCVFPAYAPYFALAKGLTGVAANIQDAQDGPAHEGRPGSGHPLYRITSMATQRANYGVVCGRPVAGGPPKPREVCDAYPLDSSSQGGTAVTKPNRRIAWVPAAQEFAKDRALTAFYAGNRVLNGDPFWVVP